MNSKQPDNSKITALYERLSRDDEQKNESVSIAHQKHMLEDYAQRNGFGNIRHFTDDGVTGTVFNRPGLNAMLEEVRAGNVATVIIKDQSRIGRDVLEVGLLKRTFEENNVRFIAAEDGFDSSKGFDIMSIFRDVINEMYVSDCSKKITAVVRAKAKQGRRVTNVSIYGYLHDPADREKWIIDPEAAAVVRRMFQLTIDGKGPAQIARMFTEEKIECPAYYKSRPENGGYTYKNKPQEPYVWSPSTVAYMLAKPEYRGCTVNCRTRKDSYKDKTGKKLPPEEWLLFENTHPAIVDAETWETAQRCRKTIKRTDTFGEANPLTGKMFCADCGAKMFNHRKAGGKPYQHWNGRTYIRPPSDMYTCSTKVYAENRFSKACSQHGIRTKVVRELILDAIRAASAFAKTNEADFIRQVREASSLRQADAAKAQRRRMAKEQKRAGELDTLIKKLFEEHALGRLPDKRFDLLSADYEREQAELEQSIAALQAELDSFEADGARADRFIEIVSRYTDFTELTTPMINEFVDRVVVHEADKSSGERQQQVDIYLNFIGKFDVPVPEPTPEELAREAEEARIRAQRRATQRKYVQRKRAECRAAQAAQEEAVRTEKSA